MTLAFAKKEAERRTRALGNITKNFDTFAAAIAFQDGVNATLGLLGAVNVKVILGNILPLVDADKGYTTTITVEEDYYPDNDRW